ncbi:MAG: MMPL family transporter [Bifidobacteriaceae bacterium]|jgi:RND superfamily putative drug exporter|nr:MMPL family transporter [Bifidobacteriaceae bacterium]
MARWLYRVGGFSARHRWGVVASWLVALAAAVAAYFMFGGALATSFSIPGTATAAVNAELAQRLPELSGVAGTVVFRSEDGGALTETQHEQISAALAPVGGIERVRAVVDPFDAESERADAVAQSEAGRAALAEAQAALDAGAEQLRAAQEQLDAAKAGLEQGVAITEDPGDIQITIDPRSAAQMMAELEAQQAELDSQAEQLEFGQAELDAQAATLDQADQLLSFAAATRTVSEDGSTAIAMVMFQDDLFSLPEASRTGVTGHLDAAELTGVTVDYSSELALSTSGLIGRAEIVGVGIAAIVLAVLLRSALAVLAPIISSLVGAGIGVAGAMALSGVVDMSSVTPVLGIMLGLAVGIDYALFIIQRHRRQLRNGVAVTESISLATGTAGNAVVFAGSTVAIALAALNLCGIPFLGVMGWIGAACVLIAVLGAVTFTPALLSLIGRRLLPRRLRAAEPGGRAGSAGLTEPVGQTEPDGLTESDGQAQAEGRTRSAGQPALGGQALPVGIGGHGSQTRTMPTGRAALTVALGIVGLVVVALPGLWLRLGLPDGSTDPTDSTSYRAFAAVAQEFGPGVNGPLVVAARLENPLGQEAQLEQQVDIASVLMGRDDVVAVAPAGVSSEGDFLAFQVIPAEGPASASTEALVHDLRGLSPLADAGGPGGQVELGVAGQASGNIDISDKLADALPLYLGLTVGLSLLIMVVVFRSLLVPLIAAAGFVLSYIAAMGAVVAIYQWGWLGSVFGVHDPGPVLNFLPLLLAGVVFGLAMDYQLFLGSGMREAHVHGLSARAAVVAGRHGAAAVVTAAALIMMSVFGGFVFSHLAMVRPLGFGLAVGVMFDAFVVRLAVMPGLMHLAGSAAWWLPRWLDRVLPNVDIEGAALERGGVAPGTAAARETALPAGADRTASCNSFDIE